MAETTIGWTRGTDGAPGYTFNPWWGCQRISPGCEHCYAETFAIRLGKDLWGPVKPRPVARDSYWQQPLAWDRKAQKAGARHRVFCASMADVFEGRPELHEPRERLFRLIEATPHLDWLLLTKRPENMLRLAAAAGWTGAWPNNVWAGATVESQKYAQQRVPELLRVPAAVRFLSCEPLLGPVDLTALERTQAEGFLRPLDGRFNKIGWLIIGSESGNGARPMDLGWARSLVDQGRAAHVPVFVKQIANPQDKKGEDPAFWPEGDWPRQFPSPVVSP